MAARPRGCPAGKPGLYDLAADPKEETNRADKHPDRVRALRTKLDAWWPAK